MLNYPSWTLNAFRVRPWLLIISLMTTGLASAANQKSKSGDPQAGSRPADLDRHAPTLNRRLQADIKLIPEGVRKYSDLAYLNDGHPRHTLDLYLPPAESIRRRTPLVVWIHGGGWQKGSKDLIGRNSFLLKHGFALASINYRLTDDTRFPGQIQDCRAAIRYLRKHARSFGIDSNRIGVWGASAGGHLAALLGTGGEVRELDGDLSKEKFSCRVQAVCDWYGPTDLISMEAHVRKRTGAGSDPDTWPETKLLGGTVKGREQIARNASPAHWVSEDDPPFLIMHGDADPLVPLNQSRYLDEQLQKKGVPCTLVVVSGAGHGFFKDSQLHQRVVDFFQKHLKPTSTAQPESQWIRLFNGRNLDGWTAKIRGHEFGQNYANTFQVRNGCLVVCYDDYTPEDLVNLDGRRKSTFDKFGHLFYQDTFAHYLLRVEYRFVGQQIKNGPAWAFRNNGVMLHGQDPTTMAKMQKFPASIEVQLLGGNGTDPRTTLNLCTPGTNVVIDDELVTRHITKSNSQTYHGDQWVTAEIEVQGDEVIRHRIDGKTVLEYHTPQLDENSPDATPLIRDGSLKLDRGTISVQSESHPTEFRKIELKRLPKDFSQKEIDTAAQFAGKWALELPNGSAGWLKITANAGQLQGELWTVGSSPKPFPEISIDEGRLRFVHSRAVGDPEYPGGPNTGPKRPTVHMASIEGDRMKLQMNRPAVTGGLETLTFFGTRIARLPNKPDLTRVRYGKPVELFNGRDLTGWRLTNSEQTNCWKADQGELFNDTPKTTFSPYARYGNLRTDREFDDFQLSLEFNVPKGGNSGIYLKGRYEVQVVDRDSKMQGTHGVGAVFNRILPDSMEGKRGGEWQTYTITLVERHITVVLNGATVIENQALAGCTNGALNADDSLPGPLYLQGDHTSVRYRNIVLRPVISTDH